MEWTRRRLIGTSAAVAALAGCLGEDDPDENPDRDDGESVETDDAGDDDRDAETILEEHDLEDHTGQEVVEIAVDPEGDGFEPETLKIDRDTVLEWTWEGPSTAVYPIDIPSDCLWAEEVDAETVEERDAGEESDRLFWAEGAYRYASRDADGEEFTGAFRVRDNEAGAEGDEDETEDE
ncbi:hypothetical protein GS429_04420 [Natronorubrum sp. JWXQ-INN-674]|uniref:Uncharacterized protein n=2 Tax=Natronorubrum halalkaliphilum TaxID=2691917 RepID=A0A6B0VID8_9EURY|nr:hypothetical protein [Natronorubrum halalkaliphilum]